MCGIVHFDGAPIDSQVLNKMAEASAYRGLDGIHYWMESNAGFAHLALHTTPEAQNETQPLISRRKDHILVADARVDNRAELERILTPKGLLEGKDHSDADLIMAAYRCWGERCTNEIFGDFAFVIWDSAKQQLFCATDAVGNRPLYYCSQGPTFRFASDLSQIMVDEGVSRDLDGYAIADFLSLNTYDPARTLFNAVKRLLPGHSLSIDVNGQRCERYWKPEQLPSLKYATDKAYIDNFRELIFVCVADRMRSLSGAVAIEVSGGLDSSSIAAIAQDLYTSGRVQARPVAFTYVFDTLNCDEREYSLSLQEEIGLEIYPIPAEQISFINEHKSLESSMEPPYCINEGLLEEVLEKAYESGCKVFLTGDGGDELFIASHLVYYDDARGGRLWKLWPWMTEAAREGFSWPGILYAYLLKPWLPRSARSLIAKWKRWGYVQHIPSWINPTLMKKASLSERFIRIRHTKQFSTLARQLQYEILVPSERHFLEATSFNPILQKNGLDAGYPLLDRRLIEFVFRIPLGLGARPGSVNTKWLLRQAMAGILPDKIRLRAGKATWREYHNFTIYHQARNILKYYFKDTIMARNDLVDETALGETFDQACAAGKLPGMAAGNFLPPYFLERWLRNSNLERPNIRFDV